MVNHGIGSLMGEPAAAAAAMAQPETGGAVGLTNQGATCYLNSLLQTLFMTPEFTRELFKWRLDAGATDEARALSIPHQLQMLFALLLTSEHRAIATVDLTKSFRWDSDQAFVQHDVQELCRLLFDALEGTAEVASLFRGELVDYLRCKPPHTHESARTDAFMDLQLAVRGFGTPPIASVVEGLRNFLTPETLDGANQYALPTGEKVDAWKGLRLATLPPLLTIHLKRFELDYTTMRNVKVNDRVEFVERLHFERRSSVTRASGEAEPAGADGCWHPREGAATPETTADALEYELYSVLVHAGTATSGHYYAYIKDVSRDTWLKFDDSRVTVASWADIQATFGTAEATSASGASVSMAGGTVAGGGLFGMSASIATAPPPSLRSTTAYMLTYRKRDVRLFEGGTEGTAAADGVTGGPGWLRDSLDPRAVELPAWVQAALQAAAAARAAEEVEQAERAATLPITVHCSTDSDANAPGRLQQLSFRRGHTAAQLLAAVSSLAATRGCDPAAYCTFIGHFFLGLLKMQRYWRIPTNDDFLLKQRPFIVQFAAIRTRSACWTSPTMSFVRSSRQKQSWTRRYCWTSEGLILI